jgi:hypothetical protein
MRISTALLGGAASLLMAAAASATPVYTSFGSLPGADFGGTGIPNDAVAKTEVFVNGTDKITIALTAHGRYHNPPVTHNGAGVFFAGPGQNCGIATDPVGCPNPNQGALWNIGFYISVEGPGADFSDYEFTLYYDFDPASGTFIQDLGTVNINNFLIGLGGDPATTTLMQGSQNLLFSGFSTAIPNVVDTPTFGPFDPNALGEYNFFLAFQKKLVPAFAGVVGIDVQVVPVPAAVWMLGSALGLLAWVRRRAAA